MWAKTRVAIAGASGVTGSSIMNALLAVPERFEVTALARPASLEKSQYIEFAKRGAIVKAIELQEPSDPLVQALIGIDVVISCMTLRALQEEMALITAADKASVGRYVPSFFAPCCPPRGVMLAREMKEGILDHIKTLYLPYTAIDVGWWYQLSLPPLPSGKIQPKMEYSTTQIIGDGDLPWALTDNRDIGKYVARIVTDPRTLNKMVFAYSEVWTQNEVWDALERVTGETIPREYISKEELLQIIWHGRAGTNSPGRPPMANLAVAQYRNLLGIRGDNTPEHARYLGYLDVKELYPDIKATPLETYIEDAFEGRVKTVYS
ncbi:NAD(P)-binding protein [Thozetella sp. PMI_491]|nr:NAD(P)-binding protein [Thozetella sp. PMI_491]